jgi:hypothetical protein
MSVTGPEGHKACEEVEEVREEDAERLEDVGNVIEEWISFRTAGAGVSGFGCSWVIESKEGETVCRESFGD